MHINTRARLIRKRHAQVSWAQIALEYDLTKADVERVAAGKYDPADPVKRAKLGLGPRTCPKCFRKITVPQTVKTWRRLDDLKPRELLFLLEHRMEM